ncbi:hypothetical protein [Aquisalimonas sp.]|uniref:hypothetical protein n=1 Tax=Aquisalimonas sp. TaxID=1872621 RepID=UPI0025C279FF|nr:hypothetical protein [Aquisalimonas sp.]
MKALLKRLRDRFSRRRGHADLADEARAGAAYASDDEPQPVHSGKRNLKQWYTSHWDWDYMPREDFERLIREGEERERGAKKRE